MTDSIRKSVFEVSYGKLFPRSFTISREEMEAAGVAVAAAEKVLRMGVSGTKSYTLSQSALAGHPQRIIVTNQASAATPVGTLTADPLDVEYDGVPMRMLLADDHSNRNEWSPQRFTPAQRAAVSAHWSAELRAKVAASAAADKEREARRVLVDLEDM